MKTKMIIGIGNFDNIDNILQDVALDVYHPKEENTFCYLACKVLNKRRNTTSQNQKNVPPLLLPPPHPPLPLLYLHA